MNATAAPNRDPVCGMTVDPTTAKYTHVHAGTTWLFCAENCRRQFAEHPERYVPSTAKDSPSGQRPRPALARELFLAAAVFVVVVALVVMVRGIVKKPAVTEASAVVTGSSVGPHEAVDSGEGGVIVSVEHDQKAGDSSNAVFTVSLDTHTIDLRGFDPGGQVKLHDGLTIETPSSFTVEGDTSSHHQNYRVSFLKPTNRQVTLSVHDVAGVGERQLPFIL